MGKSKGEVMKRKRDKFKNFSELKKVFDENVDYKIDEKPVDGSILLVIAPHAGKIEKHTSKLTKKIAGENYSYYLFEGIRDSKNCKLHITSHNFDEPKALAMLGNCEIALGIHGRQDRDDPDTIYIGGRDKEFKQILKQYLHLERFKAKISGHPFPAKKRNNVCNRGKMKMGAQLELPTSLRNEQHNSDGFLALSTAIQNAIVKRLSGHNNS